MPEKQVHAIYSTMKNREMNLAHKVRAVQGPSKEENHQMTIFEWLENRE